MSYITQLTTYIVTEDRLTETKQQRLARDMNDVFQVTLEGDEIGLVKAKDVPYYVPDPHGHTHASTPNAPCADNEANGEHHCYAHCTDMVHPTDN